VAEPSGSPPGLANRNRNQSLTVTLDFEFLTVGTVKRAKLRHRAKFLSAIFVLWCAYLDHPRKAFGDLYRCAKFGFNRCGSFSILRVSLENAYSSPKNWGMEGKIGEEVVRY